MYPPALHNFMPRATTCALVRYHAIGWGCCLPEGEGKGKGYVPAPDRVIAEYTDVAAGFLRTSNWVQAGMASGPLYADIQAAINGAVQFVTQALPFIGVAVPSGAQYRLTQDLALLNFQTIPGVSIQVAIPSPKAVLFGPSSNVVDPTNPLVAAIIADVIAILSDVNGNAATAYIGGTKASRRTEQT